MIQPRTRTMLASLFLIFTLLAAGCSSDANTSAVNGNSSTTAASQSAESILSGTATISAAASLTEVFTQIQAGFQAKNPDAKLEINFGSSGQLSTQIQEGAPVDVAAFADTTPMESLVDADLLDGAAKTFARNKLVIVTKPGNPNDIKGLEDLATSGVISLCNDNAPCGKFANQILADAGVDIDQSKITRGQDVKATLSAVTQGDAVAGIVYVTDAASTEGAATVAIPDDVNVIAEYPIGVIKGGANTKVAQAFVDYVLSDKGQAVLKEFGFLAP